MEFREVTGARMEKTKSKFGPLVIISASPEFTPQSIAELEKVGFEVTVCAEAKKAFNLSAIKPPRWTPSAFIVDVVLPQMSGFEVVRRLVQMYGEKKIPVLMMAQHKAREDELESTNAGAVGVIQKPLSPKALEDMFEKERMKKLKAEIGSMVFNIN
jgi:DNA-binding response OmpR family regulator